MCAAAMLKMLQEGAATEFGSLTLFLHIRHARHGATMQKFPSTM